MFGPYSFHDLQTDYIDYYLMHIVGMGEGLPTLMERFFDNNLIDFLVKEREAGHIRNLGFSYHEVIWTMWITAMLPAGTLMQTTFIRSLTKEIFLSLSWNPC